MSRRLTTRPVLSVTLALTLLASGAVTADAAITPQSTAPPIAQAIVASAPTLVSSSFAALPPAGAPNGTANAPFGSFPTNGSTFGILTTGSVALADDPNNFGDDGLDDQGDNVRGNTDYDVSILRVNLNVPAAANCLTFDFKFASEEFPEYVNQGVNDAFVAEVDTSNWTANNNTVTAPNNFAFAPSGGVVSIDTPGIGASAANAAGTTYDGATSLLSASTPITAGAHSVYLSIFDQGDNVYDSAALLDNLRLTTVANPAVNCKRGATQSGTISARGTVTAAGGGAVQLSAANDCDPASSTRGFQVRWTGGSFTKTTVTNSSLPHRLVAAQLARRLQQAGGHGERHAPGRRAGHDQLDVQGRRTRRRGRRPGGVHDPQRPEPGGQAGEPAGRGRALRHARRRLDLRRLT